MSVFEENIPPLRQAMYMSGAAIALMAGGWVVGQTGLMAVEDLFAWSIAAAFMLLFALLNSVLSLNAVSFAKYWGASMYSYLLVAGANGLAAWGFSGIPLQEAGTYRAIFIVVTFGFLVFLSLVNFIKQIVQFAEREEWNRK
jgi:hypothetical protein